jgi:hypothetical protein
MKTMNTEMIKAKLDFFIKRFYNSIYNVINPEFEDMIKKLETIELFFYIKKDFNLKLELRNFRTNLVHICEPNDPLVADFKRFVKSL